MKIKDGKKRFRDKMVTEAILLQCKGKVLQIGDGKSNLGFIYEVDNHTVRIYKKPGRREISCDCQNCTRFCNSGTLCKFKISAIMEYIKMLR